MARSAASKSGTPSYPVNRVVTRGQRDDAELERIRLRDHERKLREGTRVNLQLVPPLADNERGTQEARRAEEVAKGRKEKQAAQLAKHGRSKLTRNAVAMLRNEDGESARVSASKKDDRWEERVLREMFDIESDTNSSDSNVCEVISVVGEADCGLSSNDDDDSDFEDKPSVPCDGSGDEGVSAEEEDADECDDDDFTADESDEEDAKDGVTESGAPPNSHQTSHRKYDLRTKRVVPAWIYGFKSTFDSWDQFYDMFGKFQHQSLQQFSKRTSTSVDLRNKQILRQADGRKRAGKKARKEVVLVPEEWMTYSETLVCTHGQPYEPRGKGKHNHNKVRYTKCGARVNLRVSRAINGSWYLRLNASGNHNHDLNKHIWESYAENRTIKDPRLSQDVAVLRRAGANAQGILQYLRERTGKKTILRDVHNMIQRHKNAEQAGLNDAQRAFAVLDEFCRQNGGNSAHVLVDKETEVARVVTFQTAKMKRLFKAFPDVVMVDATHDSNANRYKLFSFVVHDVFGKGQYVHHALVESEHKWHVITWLKKQVARLAPAVKKEVKSLMHLLVYAKNKQEYEDAKGAMLEKLGGDTSHDLYQTFMANWDNTQDEWVSYTRGNVPHLTNNTNNRIESKWGKLKDIINDSFSIDQLLSTLITLQEYAEEQYLVEYHRVGSRTLRCNDDPELTMLALHLSPFAFDLISGQHALATGANADYEVTVGSPGRATVTSSRSGTTYEVDTRTSSCGCIFMKTCLLPCRHVMYVRSTCNFESVIPPMHSFTTRWIVQSPENNIGAGDVLCGGLKQAVLPAIPNTRALSGAEMYSEAKAVVDKIVERMSLQSTPTFRVALTWLKDFYEALNSGSVVDFTEQVAPAFPGLSQVSSVGGTGLSQMSFADGVSTNPGDTNNEVEVKLEEGAGAESAALSGEDDESQAVEPLTERVSTMDADPQNEASEPSQNLTESAPNSTKSTPKTTERSDALTWSFADRPVINGMTKAQRKRDQAKKEREAARELANKYRQGKVGRMVTFAEVAALLNGPYNAFHAKSMVDALVLPSVELEGSLSVKLPEPGQAIPVIKSIPQLTKVEEAIEAIRAKDNVDILAYWPGYGYATFDQVYAMKNIIEARHRFLLAMRTTKWVDEVEWRVDDLREPFLDTRHITKNEYKRYVNALNLATISVPGENFPGYRLLDFRESLWLHTTSIIVSLMVLRDEYQNVGIISPSYHDFALPEQKRRVAGGFGASDPRYERVIGIFNVELHWVAFLVDKREGVCYMFDPFQLNSNYAMIEKSVRSVVEGVLDMNGMLKYVRVDWCTQKDSSSCGVWCVAILEMMLSGSIWDDCMYRLLPYLRMRFLYKAIAFVTRASATEV